MFTIVMRNTKYIKKIYSSEFFKHSATLLSSNAISQIIAIIAYPFITRLYNPDVFGEFTFLLSLVTILSVLTTGKYELAIILAKSEKKAGYLLKLCLLLCLISFILFYIIFLFFNAEVATLLNKKNITTSLFLIPFLVLLSGIWQTLSCFFIRNRNYSNIGIYNITQSIVSTLFKCLFGLKHFFKIGLIGGQLLGQLFATLVSLTIGYKFLKNTAKSEKRDIINVAKEYSNFPKFELPRQLLNTFAANLPILLLSIYFDMKLVGMFSFALTIGMTPVNIFSKSIYQVLFGRMSEKMNNRENLIHECILFFRTCLVILLPLFLLFIFVPEDFFGLLLGEKWLGVGLYFKLLLPCFFTSVIIASLSFIPDIFFKQKVSMQIEIVYIILKIGALSIGIYFKNFNLAVILYSCIVTFMLSAKLIWYFYLLKKYEISRTLNI